MKATCDRAIRQAYVGLFVMYCVLTVGCGAVANSSNVQGKRLFMAGQYSQALQSFERAVQQDPQNADAYYNMAATYHKLGASSANAQYLNQAEVLYNECLNRNASHTDCYRGLAVLLVETNRKDKAFTLLRGWNAAEPRSTDPKLELARLYKEFGDTQTASDLVVDAIKQNPRDARANRAMGMLREQQGELNLALDSYQRALNANSMQPDLAAKVASLQQSIATQYAGQPGARSTQMATTLPVPTAGRY